MSEDDSVSPFRFSQRTPNPSHSAVTSRSLAPDSVLQCRTSLALVIAVFFLLLPAGLFSQVRSYDQDWSEPGVQRAYLNSPQTYPQQNYRPALSPAQPLDADQLEQLVAPIALYPDALVAQVLAASTYPGQVAEADQWRQEQRYGALEQIEVGANVQNWDPSVKALTAFPQVLAQMDRNLQWTTDLGNAYYNQPQDVMEAVQVMRRRARAAGTLESTPQQAVYYDQDYIRLMPVNPQVVYVPTYNPWNVYGDAVSPYPGFSLLGAVESFFGSSPISWGLGIAMSAFSHTPWGWLSWGLNWLADTVLFNNSDYYSHSYSVADWGFGHEGLHAYAGRGGFGRRGFENRDGYRRFGDGHDWGRGSRFGRSPERYAGNWSRNADRGFRSFGGGYGRNARQGYNHMQAAGNWRQFDRRQFDHSGYGSNANRGFSEGYRSGMRTPTYRASNSGFERRQFGGGPSRGFSSRPSFATQNFVRSEGKAQRSGGSRLFGGGHAGGGYEPNRVSSHGSGGFHFGGGGHAPKGFGGGGKGFGGGKSFGGGHSHGGGGGGHSGGHGGGKHHR